MSDWKWRGTGTGEWNYGGGDVGVPVEPNYMPAVAEVIRLARMVDDFAELQHAIKRLEELLK